MSILLLFIVFTVGAVLFGLWKGGPAERIAAGVVLINMLVGLATRRFLPEFVDTTHFINDGLAAMVLLGVTIRYGAPWMGAVMLFYAAQFALHSFYIVTARPNDYLHSLINNINFGGVIWCLIIGTAVAWRRRGRVARPVPQPAP
jgi:hypothetical protein